MKGLPLYHIAWRGYVVLRLHIIRVHKLNASSAPDVCQRLYCLAVDSALIILVVANELCCGWSEFLQHI